MAAHEFTVGGDPARAKQTAVDALTAREYAIQWVDDWTAVASKGSKVKNMLLGALAHYQEFGVKIRSVDGGHSVIRVETRSRGWWGGVWGANKTKTQFIDFRDHLGRTFDAAGVLVSHQDATGTPSPT